jgi:hypothetical protein
MFNEVYRNKTALLYRGDALGQPCERQEASCNNMGCHALQCPRTVSNEYTKLFTGALAPLNFSYCVHVFLDKEFSEH